ncbi:MAG TPA: WYL domain-containing transcriptional regulator [Verrucomicrobiae bacterium]|nr:WYL domain-containing transcriptional regulator [Verrucomicrobiae bacterium]
MAGTGFEKQDRIGRLMRELQLFQMVGRGLTTAEVAERMEISQRQAQRDIAVLESEQGVPFVKVGRRYSVLGGYWLPAVNFSVPEAMAMVIGARLMWRSADRANPFAQTAYEKLASVLPVPMRDPVLAAVAGFAEKVEDRTWVKVFAALAQAWAERRKVRITYTTDPTFKRVVWPLFIEPTLSAHSCYLVGYDEHARAARSYRLERIAEVEVLQEIFTTPSDFSLAGMLNDAWGIWTSERPVGLVLRFAPSVAPRVKETIWHRSQQLDDLPDGGVEMRLTVAAPIEVRPWILGWGSACMVVAPEAFRTELAAEAEAMAARYQTEPPGDLRHSSAPRPPGPGRGKPPARPGSGRSGLAGPSRVA